MLVLALRQTNASQCVPRLDAEFSVPVYLQGLLSIDACLCVPPGAKVYSRQQRRRVPTLALILGQAARVLLGAFDDDIEILCRGGRTMHQGGGAAHDDEPDLGRQERVDERGEAVATGHAHSLVMPGR